MSPRRPVPQTEKLGRVALPASPASLGANGWHHNCPTVTLKGLGRRVRDWSSGEPRPRSIHETNRLSMVLVQRCIGGYNPIFRDKPESSSSGW